MLTLRQNTALTDVNCTETQACWKNSIVGHRIRCLSTNSCAYANMIYGEDAVICSGTRSCAHTMHGILSQTYCIKSVFANYCIDFYQKANADFFCM